MAVSITGAQTLTGGLPFATSVHASKRYFVDQYGAPFLVKGDSPWLAFPALSTSEWDTYCSTRAAQGFNSLIVDLFGWNPTVTGISGILNAYTGGVTYDGISPFVGGDVTALTPAYWSRVDQFITTAERYGLTLFLYAVDYYATTTGEAFAGVNATAAGTYGGLIGARYAKRPNVVWMIGNDYSETTPLNDVFGSMLAGIRAQGANHMSSATLFYHLSYTSDSAYWAPRSKFNSVYSYPVQYDTVKRAYDLNNGMPAVMAEAAYVNESYTGGDVPLTIRKQIGWSLTQGGVGDFLGTEDWTFKSGWSGRLAASSITQAATLRSIFESVAWWTLKPSTTFVTSGAGTRLTATNSGPGSPDWPAASDYASSAVSADGKLAMVYLPTQRAIQVSTAQLGSSPVGTWVNASTGATTAAGSLASSVTPPSAGDWVLKITAT